MPKNGKKKGSNRTGTMRAQAHQRRVDEQKGKISGKKKKRHQKGGKSGSRKRPSS